MLGEAKCDFYLFFSYTLKENCGGPFEKIEDRG